MTEPSIYELQEPTVWADPPDNYSYSSLHVIRECPRRWFLLNSRWGQFARFPLRAVPSAIEGLIVHEALDRLAKELGLLGRPSIDTPAFSQALERCDFWRFFSERIAEWNTKLGQHPRATATYALRTTPSALANRAVRLLREQYRPSDEESASVAPSSIDSYHGGGNVAALAVVASGNGSVSELRLSHPSLPFVGVLDLVYVEDSKTTIVDFKTGKLKPEHQEQLETYAVLWWRATGQVPFRTVVQYLGANSEWHIESEQLKQRERMLTSDIQQADALLGRPAGPALPGSHCEWCAVRARCKEGWEVLERANLESNGSSNSIDVELVVASPPTPTGYLGKGVNSKEVSVVFDAPVGAELPRVEAGDRVRLIDAVKRADGQEIEIKPWTEVYWLR